MTSYLVCSVKFSESNRMELDIFDCIFYLKSKENTLEQGVWTPLKIKFINVIIEIFESFEKRLD